MTEKEKKKDTLDQVKEYLSKQWTNPFNCELIITERNGNLNFSCESWKVEIGIKYNWFNVSTRKNCGIGYFDLDQVKDIRDNRETILEIYKGKYVFNY